MADEAHVLTDKLLKKLEKETAKEYSIAVRDMSAKLQEYLEKDEIKRLEQEKLLKAGKITKKGYQDWCFRHQMMGKRWEDMLNVLSEDMHHTNEIAFSMAKDKMPDIYALNMNYGTYEIEHGGRIDTGFTLYNHDTAEYLLGDQRQLMPKPSPQRAKQIAANKDLQWNKKKIQSAVLQGVLQGENPYKVAERLRSVGQMNYNSSVRYARTMGTSAQNAGRYESYRRAKRLGVDLTIEWSATLDGRTRHDHRLMHGQRTEVDEPFHTPDGFTIYYPADCTGDSDAPQKEIWNCRCTLKAWVKGFEGNTVKSSPKMGDMSFEEWQKEKAPKTMPKETPAAEKETFAYKVDILKQEIGTGSITEEHLQRAGNLLANEYSSMVKANEEAYMRIVAPYETEFRRAEKTFNEYQSNYNSIKNSLTAEEETAMRKELSRLGKEVVDKRDAFYAARKPYMLDQDKNVEWLSSKLSEVRSVGYNGIDLSSHLMGGSSPEIKRIEYAYAHYPTDWVEKSVAKDNMLVKKATRGYYERRTSYSEIAISGSGGKANAVAIHEVAHRFEDTVPNMARLERDFYTKRTAGEARIALGKGYGADEYTKKDKFIDKYMGKDYGTGKEYELVSMGFQYAYTEPDKLAKDPEFQKWIYGQLMLL